MNSHAYHIEKGYRFVVPYLCSLRCGPVGNGKTVIEVMREKIRSFEVNNVIHVCFTRISGSISLIEVSKNFIII